MSEIDDIRARFARKIEDGKRVMSFATSDEWNWYVNTVLKPTIEEYTDRIIKGTLPEREDMHVRGMISGIQLVISSTQTFMDDATKARLDAKKFEEDVKNNGS